MTSSSIKPPTWFWVVSVIALLWNVMGVASYLADAFISLEQLEAMTLGERALYENRPAWVTGTFAIAVFGGLVASIALLFRKKWAKPLFLVSLIAAILQFTHWLFMTNAPEIYGPTVYFMPLLVFFLGVYEVYFANQGIQRKWLH